MLFQYDSHALHFSLFIHSLLPFISTMRMMPSRSVSSRNHSVEHLSRSRREERHVKSGEMLSRSVLDSLSDDKQHRHDRSSQIGAATLSLFIDSIHCRFQSMSTTVRWIDETLNTRSHWHSALLTTSKSSSHEESRTIHLNLCLGCLEVHAEMSTNQNDHWRSRISDEDAIPRGKSQSCFQR